MREYPVLWTKPLNLVPSEPDIDIQFIVPTDDGGIAVTLVSSELALYVVLTTTFEGRFEENAVVLQKDASRTVRFVPPRCYSGSSSIDPEEFRTTLRVEHLLSYR